MGKIAWCGLCDASCYLYASCCVLRAHVGRDVAPLLCLDIVLVFVEAVHGGGLCWDVLASASPCLG